MSNRTHSIVSTGAGEVMGIKARLDNLVGIFKILAEQHGAILALMKRLQDRPEKKPELWPEIRRELRSHERGEVRGVYPVLRAQTLTRVLAEQHDQDAAKLEHLIDEIDAAEAQDWRPRYDQLVDAVVRHAEKEEKEIFPKAQKVLGDEAATDLVAKFFAAKKPAATV